ncbi:MAG: YbbR-like domain-containing protein [Bacteroidaceae bacterium]|nr:YbbR-like domain-containing protein [Bacteroidaceae bacterium]
MGKRHLSQFTERIIKGKELLSKATNKEFWTFMCFVLVAACFWCLETLNEDYEIEINVPLTIVNVPDNVVITSDIPKEIKARVLDKGLTFIDYLYYRKEVISINFNDYQAKGNAVRIPVSEIQKQLLRYLDKSSRLISFKPENFDMVYTRGKAKRVPVRLKGEVSAKQQYAVTGVTFDPDTMTIYAPEEILDTIHVVFTAPVSYHELEKTTSFETEMSRPQNVKFVPEKVSVNINVAQLTEKTLEVPITPVNVPSGKTMRTFPSKVKVTFQTVLGEFDKIKAEEFSIQVDYNSLNPNDNERCVPFAAYYPASIKHMGIWPAEVEYLVEDE